MEPMDDSSSQIAELWQPEVSDLTLLFFARTDEFNWDGFKSGLGASFSEFDGPKLFINVFFKQEQAVFTGFASVEPDQKGYWDFDLRLRPSLGMEEPRGVELKEYFGAIAGATENHGHQWPMLVSSTLRLSLEHWIPSVALPVSLPGILDGANGAPEITGFEFRFREPGYPLRRADISLSTKSISIKQLISFSSVLGMQSVHDGLVNVFRFLPFLANRKPDVVEEVQNVES
jgi:hypothetical protein